MGAFPADFQWGIGTAAYSVEGSTDSRGETIWDRFTRRPGAVRDGTDGEQACDQVRRWEGDLENLRRLGVNAYRFSVAWSRVFPAGSGEVNARGLDFYQRVVDGLTAHGIRPVAVLHHWDLPQALEERGGWPDRDTAARFGDYASLLFDRLGDRVDRWISHHDPWASAFLGYGSGKLAPGRKQEEAALRAAHVLLLSHARAAEAFAPHRRRGSSLGIALTLQSVLAASDSPEDLEAAAWADAFLNRWLLDPLLGRGYPSELREIYVERHPAWEPLPEDLAALGRARPDFIGVNYFTCRRVRQADRRDTLFRYDSPPPDAQVTASGWEVHPDGLLELLLRLDREYEHPELYIAANGAAFADEPAESGVVEDRARIAFLDEHLIRAHRALGAGVRLRGYFPWSFLDGFEWSFGFSRPFGLLAVDRRTLARSWKRSAHWYRDRIADGRL